MTATVDLFWRKVSRTDECWLWTGAIGAKGYGAFHEGGRYVLAHRYSYALHKGPIPAGLHIDHLCRAKACVNPQHLEAVTPKENVRRGIKGVLTPMCRHGHVYSEERNKYGRRICRPCQLRMGRESSQRRRDRAKAVTA